MNTLKEDLICPLGKVERAWLRIPVTLIGGTIIFPIILFLLTIHAIGLVFSHMKTEWWGGFMLPCLRGSKCENINM